MDQSIAPAAPNADKISVIIPVRNEEHSIGPLLDCLKHQTLTPAEVIIADGGSTDKTLQVVEAYDRGPLTIHLIRGGQGFPGRNRNLGAAAATNEWIAFIDAGVKPELDWLDALARRAHVQKDADVVYGSFEPQTDTLFKRCAVMAYIAPPVERDGRLIRSRSITSVLMKRTVWQAVGGFPEHLRSAEDLLFMNKIEESNFRVAFAIGALVHWQVQATAWGTFKRFTTYARHNLRAGLWRQWQAPIFGRYGLLLASALPALIFGARWLWVTLGLWLSLLSLRAVVAVWRNRYCFPGGLIENCVRMLVLVPLIALLDAATFAGTIQWLVKDKLSFSDEAENYAGGV